MTGTRATAAFKVDEDKDETNIYKPERSILEYSLPTEVLVIRDKQILKAIKSQSAIRRRVGQTTTMTRALNILDLLEWFSSLINAVSDLRLILDSRREST